MIVKNGEIYAGGCSGCGIKALDLFAEYEKRQPHVFSNRKA